MGNRIAANPSALRAFAARAARSPLGRAAALAAGGMLLLYLLFGASVLERIHRGRLRGMNVILVTIDTLRADHLGCYGKDRVATPALDGLASDGVRFGRCIAQTPLTLPSHTTILSGTYPLHHQVRDNGGFLVPQRLLMLPEALKASGFATAGFVASYVLHSKWGINQGFDYYGDSFDLSRYKSVSLGEVQRPAEDVLTEARGWLDKNGGRRFFAWIHLYDPHTPYEPPSPFREQYPGHPYRGEVAYTDAQLGSFFSYLKEKKLWERTLLVVTGDHGEGLGEHGEATHGYFIYDSTVHVPLIVHAPFRFPARTIAAPVEHVDILPTILEAVGVSLPAQTQGRSLLPQMFGDQPARTGTAYTETWYPRLHYGWSELKALYRSGWKYIQAPEAELFDRRRDPGETDNVVRRHSPAARDMRRRIEEFCRQQTRDPLAPEQVKKTDRDSLEKLAALGYLTTFVDTSKRPLLVDPKRKFHIYKALSRARGLADGDREEEAIRLVSGILAEDPEIIDAYMLLGNFYFKRKEFENAIQQYRAVLERRADYNFAMINVVNSLRGMGRLEEAKRELASYIRLFPEDAAFRTELGDILFQQNDLAGALAEMRRAVALDPGQAGAHNRMGEILFRMKDFDAATAAIRRAREINPALPRSSFTLALIAEARGDREAAAALYRRELEVNPKGYRAAYNLAELLRQGGGADEAQALYRQAMEAEPDFNIPYFMVAKHLLDLGADLDEAVRLCERGVAIRPEDKYTAFGHFILADIFSRRGKPAESARSLRQAEAIMRRVAR